MNYLIFGIAQIIGLLLIVGIYILLSEKIDNQHQELIDKISKLKPCWPDTFPGTRFTTITFYTPYGKYGPYTTKDMKRVSELQKEFHDKGCYFGSCNIHMIEPDDKT